MTFPVVKERTLLHADHKYEDAVFWQNYYAERLVHHKQQDRFGIAIHVIPGIKPKTFGVYLEPYL